MGFYEHPVWCWEGLEAGRKGDDRGWDGWMASPTWWTWVWVNSGSWWWTGRPGMLQFMGSQRVGHDWVTELNWTELIPGARTQRWAQCQMERQVFSSVLNKGFSWGLQLLITCEGCAEGYVQFWEILIATGWLVFKNYQRNVHISWHMKCRPMLKSAAEGAVETVRGTDRGSNQRRNDQWSTYQK